MEITEHPAYVHEKSGQQYRRRFIDTGAANDLRCNLTELRAASDAAADDPDPDAKEVGFVRHSDFVGHLLRYLYAGKVIQKVEPLTILDVGCGELQLPFFLHKNRFHLADAAQYYGLELRATAGWLPAANKINGKPKQQLRCHMNLVRCDLLRDDLATIPDWPGQFDLVTCFETFEHVPRAQGANFMEKLFSWTMPGGVCLFSTPNAGVSRSTAENHLDADGSSREWSYDAKLDVAVEAGFVVNNTFGTFTGITYLPEEVQERIKTDPCLKAMRAFLDLNMFNAVIAAAYPTHSNNSLFHMTRPIEPVDPAVVATAGIAVD